MAIRLMKKFLEGITTIVLLLLLVIINGCFTTKSKQASVTLKDVSHCDFSSIPALKPRIQPILPKSFKEIPFISNNPEIKALPIEKQRGYVLFSMPITQPVYRKTDTLPSDRIKMLSAFGTPGEYEPMTFTLYPLRDIKNLRVKISTLRSGKNTIDQEHLDLRAVTYWNIRYPLYSSPKTYRATPELLEKVNSIELHKNVCQRFWLKVHVPDNAKPGLYKGCVTIYETGAKKGLELPVAFRVLKYTLKRDPTKHYSAFYYGSKLYNYEGLNGKALEKARENELKAMLSYGFDIFPVVPLKSSVDANGDIQLQMRYDDAFMDKICEMGFKGPIPLYFGHIDKFYAKYVPDGEIGSHWKMSKKPSDNKIFKAIESAYRNLKIYAKKKGWPELIANPMDEPCASSAEFTAKVYAAVHRAGIKTYITKDPTSSDADIYHKYNAIDVWCSQPFAIPYDKVIADKRYEYWSYPNHIACENRNSEVMQKGGRMTYGFGFWRSGYTTLMPWHWRYLTNRSDQFDYLKGSVSGCGVRIDDNQEIIPTVYWEAFREGYDDLRYLYTLQEAIIQRKGTKNKECQKIIKKGETLIQSIWDSIEPQKKYLNSNMWTDKTFNAKRWQMALLTQKLLNFPVINNKRAPSVLAKIETDLKKKDLNIIAKSFGNKKLVKRYKLDYGNYKNWIPSGKDIIKKIIPMQGNASNLQINIDIDHKINGGGDGGFYPIGWPRITHHFKKGEINLTKYAYFYFKVKVDSNRNENDDDITPFFLNFGSDSKGIKSSMQLNLGDKPRSWIPVIIPLDKVILKSGFSEKKWQGLSYIQLGVREAKYKDKTKLEFEIKDIALLKFINPIIETIYSDDVVVKPIKDYPIVVKGFGFDDAVKQKATLVAILKNGEKKILITEKTLLKKDPRVILDFDSIKAGTYLLTITIISSNGQVLATKNKQIEIVNGFLDIK